MNKIIQIKRFFKATAFFIVALFLIPNTALAQEKLGLQNSNFGGTHSIYLNPALIATPANEIYIDFFTRGLHFQNNFLNYNAPVSLNDWYFGKIPPANQGPGGRASFGQNWLQTLDLNGGTANFNLHNDIRLLSFMFPVSRKTFFSFNIRQRNGIQVIGLDEPFAQIARYGINNSKKNIFGPGSQLQYGDQLATENGFKAHFESWQEYGFTLASIMRESKSRLFSAGVTFKILRGMGVAHMSSDNLRLTVENGDSITFNDGGFRFANSSDYALLNPVLNLDQWFEHETTGAGLGFDLGLTWQKKRKRSAFKKHFVWDIDCNYRRQYDWKFGASLMDIGFINHGRNVVNRSANFNSPQGLAVRHTMLNGFTQQNNTGFENLQNDLFNNIDNLTTTSSFTSYLPAALSLQYDLRLGNRFYLGVNAQKGLKTNASQGLNANDFLSFVPRVESYLGEFALPITVSSLFNDKVAVGFFTRFWMFHFGSDNLLGLLGSSSNTQFTGASIYGGFSIPIPFCHDNSWVEEKIGRTIVKEPDPVFEEEVVEEVQVVEEVVEEVEEVEEELIGENPDTLKSIPTDTVFVNDPQAALREADLIRKQKQLEERIAELEKRANSSNCADCEQRLRTERQNNDRLKRELDQVTVANRNLERQVLQLNDRIRQLESERLLLNEKIKNCENTDQTRKLVQDKLVVIEQEKALCEQKTKDKENEIVDYVRRIIELERELKDCRTKLTEQTGNEELKKTYDEINRLEALVKALELDKRNCISEKNELSVRVNLLQKEADDCKKLYQTLQAKVVQMESEKIAFVKENTDLKARIAALEKQIANGDNCAADKAELEKLKLKVSSLENEKKKCEDEKVILQNQLSIKDATIKKLNDTLSTVVSNAAYCEIQLENAIREFQATANKLSDVQKKLRDCESKLKDCDNNSSESSSSSSTDLDKERERLMAEISDLESQLDKLKIQISTKDSELTRLKAMETQLKKCEEDKAALLSQLSQKESRIKSLSDSLSSSQSKLEYSESQLASAIREFQATANKLSDVQKSLKETEAKLQDCLKNNGSSTNDQAYQKLLADFETQKQSLESVKKQLAEQESLVKSLRSTETELKNKLSTCEKSNNTQDLNAQIATLDQKLKAAESAVQQLKTAESTLKTQLKKCEDEKQALASQVNNQGLKQDNTESEKQIQSLLQKQKELETNLDNSNKKVAALEKEIASLKTSLAQSKSALENANDCKEVEQRAVRMQVISDSLTRVNAALQKQLIECETKQGSIQEGIRRQGGSSGVGIGTPSSTSRTGTANTGILGGQQRQTRGSSQTTTNPTSRSTSTTAGSRTQNRTQSRTESRKENEGTATNTRGSRSSNRSQQSEEPGT